MADSKVRLWSDDEVRALTEHSVVFARDRDAHAVPIPASLRLDAPVGPLPPSADWRDQVASMHPEDRTVAVRGWWETVSEPGSYWHQPVRYQDGDHWVRRDVGFVNLLHQPGIEVVLVIIGMPEPWDPAESSPQLLGSDGGGDEFATWEAPTWAIQRIDATGQVISTEGMVEAVFGRSEEELAGQNVLELLHPGDYEAALSMWMEVLGEPGATRTIRQRIVRPDAAVIWLESTVTNRLDGKGGGAVVVVSHDVSERRAEEAALLASKEEFRLLAEQVPVAVFRCDGDGRLLYVNNRMSELSDQFGGVTTVAELTTPSHQHEVVAALTSLRVDSESSSVETEVPSPDGEARFVIDLHRSGSRDDASNTLVGVITDVTETAVLRHLVNHDALTGLGNRRALEDHLANQLADGPVSLAFVDLDGFKPINDTHGHRVGDEVLSDLGARLGELARRLGGFAGRWGGDEFLLVVPDPDPATWIHDLESVLDHPSITSEGPLSVGGSVGVVTGDKGDEPSDLVRRADETMYAAKRTRRRRSMD